MYTSQEFSGKFSGEKISFQERNTIHILRQIQPAYSNEQMEVALQPSNLLTCSYMLKKGICIYISVKTHQKEEQTQWTIALFGPLIMRKLISYAEWDNVRWTILFNDHYRKFSVLKCKSNWQNTSKPNSSIRYHCIIQRKMDGWTHICLSILTKVGK